MSRFGIRRRLKTGIKKILGEEESKEVVPPNSYVPTEPPKPPEPRIETAPPVSQAEPIVEEPPAPQEPVEEKKEIQEPVEPKQSEAPKVVHANAPDESIEGQPLTMEAVQEILDDMVRPALQGDGGDIALVKIEENNIYVQLVGACSTCPSSVMTMKMGVEALLREEFPSMNELIDVGN